MAAIPSPNHIDHQAGQIEKILEIYDSPNI